MISYWNILGYLLSSVEFSMEKVYLKSWECYILSWCHARVVSNSRKKNVHALAMFSGCFLMSKFFHYIRILKCSYFWLRFHVVTWDVEHLNCLLKDCMESASPFLKYLWWERAYNWSNTKSYFTFFRNSCVVEAFFFSFVQIMQVIIIIIILNCLQRTKLHL